MPKKKSFKIAFVADPLKNFDPAAETTSFIMDEVCKRGWECYHIELKDMYLKNDTPHGMASQIQTTKKNKQFTHKIVNTKTLKLETMDAVFIRKDPPVDLNYIDHLSILEFLVSKTLVINHPTWIKHGNEKLFTFYFKNLAPHTIVTQNKKLILDFVKKHKTAILKPLNMSGGKGVLWVNSKDPSLNSIVDILSEDQTRYIMAQEYVPAASKGDKRILILDGEILGAFTRVPTKDDFRGNLHSGAKLVKGSITSHDKKIVSLLKPTLKKMGLYFVGIDVIGKYVTEINTTSPMGIREINQLEKTNVEKTLVNWLESKLK